MSKPRHRFGREFEAASVCQVKTSGRAQREIAENLNIVGSTLHRRLDKRREHDPEAPPSEPQEDLAAELKRLRSKKILR